MIRKIFVLITLLLQAISCDETDIQPTIDNYRLSEILNYSSTSASLPYGFVTFEYDDKGNLRKKSMFDYPNTVFSYTLYEYSNNNKLRREQSFDGEVGHLTLGAYVDYFYDKENLTRAEWHRADGTFFYTLHNEYDRNNLSKTYKENDELGVHHLFNYTYDDKNRLTSESAFMYDNELENFSEYYYDEDDRLVKTLRFDRDSILSWRIEKVYHGSDFLPDEELTFSGDDELRSRIFFHYDGWGNLVGRSAEGDNSCPVITKRYNGKLLLEEIRYHPGFGCTEWSVTRYKYEPK